MVKDLALTGNEYAYLVISETRIQNKRWDEDSGQSHHHRVAASERRPGSEIQIRDGMML